MPLKEEQQSVNAIAAKKETFIIEQNAKLSQKAETYVNADSDVLKKVKLDLSAVDVTTPGTYQAVASLQKERVSFAIKVVENAKPVIQAAHADFQFVIESNSTMQEVRDYAGVTAADASGNDLSALITGWDEEAACGSKNSNLPAECRGCTGAACKKSVRVQYLLTERG